MDRGIVLRHGRELFFEDTPTSTLVYGNVRHHPIIIANSTNIVDDLKKMKEISERKFTKKVKNISLYLTHITVSLSLAGILAYVTLIARWNRVCE